MRIRFIHVASALLVAAALSLAGSAAAQAQARIQGVITDGKGAPVEGVKITVTTTSNARFKLELTSDAKGKWGTILNNAVPPYTYKFEKAGFLPQQLTKKIGINSVEAMDIVLLTAEQAVASGKAEIKKDPFVEAYNEAVEKYQAGQNAEALAKAEEATTLGPDKANAWGLAAKMAASVKAWDKVVSYSEKALELDPEATELYPLLVEAYRQKGDKAKVAEYEKKFAAANPDNPDILYNQAVDLYNKSDFKGAAPILLKVIEAKPDYAKAHFLLGMSYVNLNKIPDMKKHLQEYLKLDPKGADAAVAKEMLDAFK
ncbi:MAG TPA: tetratricopeptide repeat protein [Thermoanaerobaculia bacterium]|nr:tetratricopeptide repeat protein [Thermoanaerobaculia bacterium]HQR67287.1 tetratricopeptide repeat protein [Thermoanaerobaculia bacterium]